MSFWATLLSVFSVNSKNKIVTEVDFETNGIVSNKTHIIAVLNEIKKHNELVGIKVKGLNKLANTSILGINPSSGQIYIDATTDEQCNAELKENVKVFIYARYEHVPFNFHAYLLSAKTAKGKTYYSISIPDEAHYKQRRKDHRISINGLDNSFKGYYSDGQLQQLSGYVSNVSNNGACITLNNYLPVDKGDKLIACGIIIKSHGKLNTDFIVRNVNPNRDREVTRISGNFDNMNKTSKKHLEKLIIQHERALAQQTANTRHPEQ